MRADDRYSVSIWCAFGRVFQDAFWTRNAAKQSLMSATSQYRKRLSLLKIWPFPLVRDLRETSLTEEVRSSNLLTSTIEKPLVIAGFCPSAGPRKSQVCWPVS
jgi:hypothetical protein